MARCDLCGASCEAHMLETMLPRYQVGNIKDICPKCSRWTAKVKTAMLNEIPGRMREQIAAKASEPPPMRWWQRLVGNTEGQRRHVRCMTEFGTAEKGNP